MQRERVVRPADRAHPSVAALKEAQRLRGTSLGAVRPTAIDAIWHRDLTETEHEEWLAKERQVLSQYDWLRDKKPLEFIPVRFMISFQCADGSHHNMTIHDWGLYEQFRRAWKGGALTRAAAAEQVCAKLRPLCDLK
jgi:hypothetical protein